MTFEEESIEFLENHIDGSFGQVMATHTIEEVAWFTSPEYRAYAIMNDDKTRENDMICLFPPFIPTGANN